MPDLLKINDCDCYIDCHSKMIHTPGQNVFLSDKEFNLFLLLFDSPGTVFSREELFNKLWHDSADLSTVAVHIMRIRRKIEPITEYTGTIENGYAKGYFLKPPRRDDTKPGE